MLDLLLLRHAKSSWDEPGLADHDRELAPRGRKAAPRMGKLLAKQRLVPDLVLCSTAVRTRQTLELVVAELPAAPPVTFLKSLYLAAPGRLLEIVRRQEPACRRLLVVGHNPGMHSFAQRLVGKGPAEARERLAEKLPTAVLAQIRFDAESWAAVEPGAGELVGFWRPKELG